MSPGSFVMQAIPLVMVFFVFYAVVIRPGRASEGRRWAAVKELSPGDRVILTSGMVGTFIALHGTAEDGEYEVEIADGVRIRVLEGAVKSISKLLPVVDAPVESPTADEAAQA